MLRIIRGLLSCGVFVFRKLGGMAAEPGATTPAGKKLDLTFVPNDAVAAAVVHPQRVIKSPQFELWPTEIFSAGGKKEWGFDPMQIDLAVSVAGMPQMAGGQQPQPGLDGPATTSLWRRVAIHAGARCQTRAAAGRERWPRRNRQRQAGAVGSPADAT